MGLSISHVRSSYMLDRTGPDNDLRSHETELTIGHVGRWHADPIAKFMLST